MAPTRSDQVAVLASASGVMSASSSCTQSRSVRTGMGTTLSSGDMEGVDARDEYAPESGVFSPLLPSPRSVVSSASWAGFLDARARFFFRSDRERDGVKTLGSSPSMGGVVDE